MSFDVVSTSEFSKIAFDNVLPDNLDSNTFEDEPVMAGILSDSKHIWQAKGPCLEVRNIQTTHRLGCWRFGGILRESDTKISVVEELKRPNGRLPFLVIALDCSLGLGVISLFDIFGSKILRTVHIGERITSLHVIDSGDDKSAITELSPLKYFDGVIAVGTLGGNVYLLDLCKQVCENVIQNLDVTVRDEVNPCQMVILNKEKVGNIKKYVERSVDREEHLAIHLNVVKDAPTEHFILKGEQGDDRVHVDRSELEVSSLFYSTRIASLLIGYNFGAFQVWDLRSLNLTYTSPICEGNIPVTHFTTQEPADDPKAYCYIWVSYSHNLMFHSGLPFAVMYSFYFNKKSFVNGYGNLYEDFQHCSIRFQLELGDTQSSSCSSPVKGGLCLGFQSFNKCISNRDQNALALCFISWLIWDANKEVNSAFLLFDLNQWYKEQMPCVPIWSHSSNYVIKNSVSELFYDMKLDQKSLVQFMGVQRLEEHFCPTSLSFDLWGITENAILKMHNSGIQRLFLDKISDSQHLALLRPDHYSDQVLSLGLTPLFCDIPSINASDIDFQRELLLSVALEQRLVGWLCQASTKLANNAFSSSGLTIYNILNWAFQRAIVLKNSLYHYCVPLFDYSGTRLDDNTLTMLLAGTNQMRNLCSVYRYVSSKLMQFVSDGKRLLEEQRSLEHLVTYFEVVLWMTNVGLLPECQPSGGILFNLVSAPYLVDDLREFYNKKRAQLNLASKETFVEKDCLLFIDNMINNKAEAELIRQQWQEDGGTGLYPPPSLQSVLRIYLLDGLDVTFKHSLVTYTLLDIAMTVDEHNKIVKLLLKFPQIFNLTQSNIKIVQAFWHLDHDDYETALESILDPSVLLEDLQHWHHSVMMKSLLMQEQSGLALLYLQIRKPPIQEENDLLTVISLLISKNMLDEAFKFRLQHKGSNESALLTHIFNECNKNEVLHTLLYRRLSTDEEKAFFNYIHGTRNPKCEDLQIFYYLLRSRFLEAFDSYSLSKRKLPSVQGLVGQRDATTTDNVVKMFKTLLPDVNRNLVELVQKERTNLWKEIPRPTPFSVFVHNPKDQVQYKSSVIFAALSKAKQTFVDGLDKTTVETEQTPFLRTPRIFKSKSFQDTPVLRCRITEQNEKGEEYGPSPCKIFRLSPRVSKATPIKQKSNLLYTVQSKFSTPLVKRKKQSFGSSDTAAVLPQSILKSRTFLEDSLLNENTSTNTSLQLECENSIVKYRFGLTPRKSLRTPLKSHVKFNDLRYSTSSAENSDKNSSLQADVTASSSGLSKNMSVESVDNFHSRDHSLEKQADVVLNESIKIDISDTSLMGDASSIGDDRKTPERILEVAENIGGKTKIPVEENDLSTNRLNFQSPKARRSYKRSLGETTPVRSSPRTSKRLLSQSTEEDSSPSPSKSVRAPKLTARKPLSRSVLEHNAFSTLKSDETISEVAKKYAEKSLNLTSNLSVTDSTMELETSDSFRLSDLSFSRFNESSEVSDQSFTSKITEVSSVETRRETVRRSRTGALLAQDEFTKESISKKVEVFTDQNKSIKSLSETEASETGFEDDENQVIEDKIDLDLERHKSSVVDNIKYISNEKQVTYIKDQLDEEINVYEDLSSGSEDIMQVIQQIDKEKEANVHIDVPSTSNQNIANSEKKSAPAMMETIDNESLSISYDLKVSAHEQAFIDQSDVIEIGSSSEDELECNTAFASRSSSSSSVLDSIFENAGDDNSANSSASASDFDQNEETQETIPNAGSKLIDDSICTDSNSEINKYLPEEGGLNEVGEQPLDPFIVMADDTFDECNIREVVVVSTEDVTSIQEEPASLLQNTDNSEDRADPERNTPTTLGNNEVDMDELVLEEPDRDLALKDKYESREKRSISLQCSLGNKDFEPSNSGIEESVIKFEESNELTDHQHSVSIQCNLACDGHPVKEDDTCEKSIKVDDQSHTPNIVLKTVKKTYRGRKTLMDATPKLAVHLTKRTYSKKITSATPVFDDDHSNMQDEGNDLSSATECQVAGGIKETLADKFESFYDNKVSEATEEVERRKELSMSVDDATPKLSTHLIRKTYSRCKQGSVVLDESGPRCQGSEKTIHHQTDSRDNDEVSPKTIGDENKKQTCHETTTGSENIVGLPKKDLTLKTVAQNTTSDVDDTSASSSKENQNKNRKTSNLKQSPVLDQRSDENFEKYKPNVNYEGVNFAQLDKKSPHKTSSLIPDNDAKDKTDNDNPSTSKPAARLTRKRSTRLSQHESAVSSTSEGLVASGSITPRRSFVLRSDDSPKTTRSPVINCPPKIRRTRRLLTDVDIGLTNIGDNTDVAKTQKDAVEPVRSSIAYGPRSSKTTKNKTAMSSRYSVDEKPVSQIAQRRLLRSRSIDLDNLDTSLNEEASTSKEVLIGSERKGKSKASSHMGDYTLSRRLTRRQASMLQSISGLEDDIKSVPIIVEEIDPVQLLDKPEFKGKRDPEEAAIYERSPSTSSDTSRNTRSSSVISDIIGVVTPTKRASRAKNSASSGGKIQSKTTSIDLAPVVPDSPSAPKRTKNMTESEQNNSTRTGLRTRSRTNSVSSIQSDNSDVSNTSVRTTRSRKPQTVKMSLPEIEEERGGEPGSSTEVAKKSGRKRK